MRIRRIRIENFRNFHRLDVALDKHAVIVGENKVGKTNLLAALSLVLDPTLPDSARRLRADDFWDGLGTAFARDHKIVVSLDLVDWEDNSPLATYLWDALIEADPPIARLTYEYRPRAALTHEPTCEDDYEYVLYGGEGPVGRPIRTEIRHAMPVVVLPALRDVEKDLETWRRSPLRPLIDELAAGFDSAELESIAQGFSDLAQGLADHREVKALGERISSRLAAMVGRSQAITMDLKVAPTHPSKLLRSLRPFIDGRDRGIHQASLGTSNVLFLVLKLLELEQLVRYHERAHTILGIEEPEAHLHPHLQRLVYREFLRSRGHLNVTPQLNAGADGLENSLETSSDSVTKLLTTHSPHVVSVSPVRSFVLLRRVQECPGDDIVSEMHTVAVSTATVNLDDDDVADLERYLDVTRGEIIFARGVIFVEGEAEMYLVPAIAKRLNYDLDEYGISVCSVAGTNFAPFIKLAGPNALRIPHAILTDGDPQPDGQLLGRRRTTRFFSLSLESHESNIVCPEVDDITFSEIMQSRGFFITDHTLEIDIFRSGQHVAVTRALEDLTESHACRARAAEWRANPDTCDHDRLLRDIAAVGKGRYAQALVSYLDGNSYPNAIQNAITYVVERCR